MGQHGTELDVLLQNPTATAAVETFLQTRAEPTPEFGATAIVTDPPSSGH